MDLLRVGFIGAGGNTRLRHLPGFIACKGVEPRLVCNRSRESSEKVAQEFGIPEVTEDWQEVVSHPDVDAICIGTWPNTHAEMTIAALEAGKHVLCEARMAADLSQAQSMLDASLNHPELVAQLVPSPLSLSLDASISELVSGETLGELLEVFVCHTFADYQNPDEPLPWRLDRRLSGVNALTLGILHEMVQRWIPEEPKVQYASAGIFTNERLEESTGQYLKVDLPESLDVVASYKSGARLVYHISGVDAAPPRLEVRISGTTGSIFIDLAQQTITLFSNGRESGEAQSIPPAQKRGWQVEKDFISSIRNAVPVKLTDFKSGLRYMRFSQAVDDAWRLS